MDASPTNYAGWHLRNKCIIFALHICMMNPNRIRCSLGIFAQADGSAYLEQGNTKVLAAVYGPHEVNILYPLDIA